MRSNLPEVPAQFVQGLGSQGRQQLIPDDLLGALGDARELRRNDDPERPCGQRSEQGGVTFEEHPEVIEPRVGDDIDDHAAAREMNADRQAIREVPECASLSLADGNVRQVRLLDPR